MGKYKRTEKQLAYLRKRMKKIRVSSFGFKKNHKINKGRILSAEHKRKIGLNTTKWLTGRKYTEEHKENIRKGNLRVVAEGRHNEWKGKKATYHSIHNWLRRRYGSADHCENILCNKSSKNYQYALLKGKEHDHERESYVMLCVSCHQKYDRLNIPIKLWNNQKK